MREMKPIVTDTYDFPTLIGEGYVYVDKTARKQISEKGYAKPYSTGDRKVICVGVNYDSKMASVSCEVVNFSDEVVKSHPGLRKPSLIPLIGKSRATVERALALLIAAGRIEFRGASKTGGYYVVGEGTR